MHNRRVLIVDDDPEIQVAYRAVLAPPEKGPTSATKLKELVGDAAPANVAGSPRFELELASQGPEGVELADAAHKADQPFAVAFIDIRMPPGFDGLETAARIRNIDRNIELVIVTAYSDRSREEIVRTVGAPERLLFLRKPFDPEELIQLALSLTSKWNLAREAEEQQRKFEKSEARFRALVETTSDWVWETDAEGCFTYCSPLCETIYGYTPQELQGRPFFDLLMQPEDIAESKALFAVCVDEKRGFNNIERRSTTKEGEIIYVESSGIPISGENGRISGFRGIDRDITRRKAIERERRELEIQYRQSQKLEALGTLAGGIAHDLNNVLTPIMGGAQLSLMSIASDHPLFENLKAIEHGVQKAADLIRQILAFSRKQVLTTTALDLTHLIRDFGGMLRRLIREDVHITYKLEDPLWTIEGDKNQMEQILINLVVNAKDAVSAGGEITIQTANKVLADDDPAVTDHRLEPGSFVVMSVCDNGQGIDPAVQSRIFDPFFTTKEAGGGTGLGLATTYGIVKQHGGEILVDTAVGRGTRFDIYFHKTEDRIQIDLQKESQIADGGHETILLVEDDLDVRRAVSAILTHYGYRVIVAEDGIEAIRIFKEREGRIDLLFTDLVMPSMGGQPLAKALREHKTSLPVVFMSGHPLEVNTKILSEAEGNDFVQKPFRPPDVARKVRRMLDAGLNRQ